MTTERERFEAWAEQNVGQPDFGGYHTDGGRWFYRHNFIRMCWGAWQAALAAERQPLDDEGLALLPVEATAEMCNAMGEAWQADRSGLRPWDALYRAAVKAYLAKPRQQQEPVGYQMTEADGPWKSAVIDALIVDCIYSNEHENDPRKAIADLLAWECRLALDPAVSKEAAALRDSGKMTEADIRQAYEHGWTDAMHVATGGIEVPAEREAAWQASNARAHLMQFVVSGG